MSPKPDPAAMGTPEGQSAGTKEVPQIMDVPRGQPTSYGPMLPADGRQDRQLAVNPFWSDAVKEDALIRSLRPQGLPEDGTEGIPDMRQLMSMILQQNAQLKRELDDLRGQVKAQPTQVVEQVLGKAEEGSVSVTVEPAPLPLRSREGPERFGLEGLDESLKKRVEDDTVLWLRQYYVYYRSQKASMEKVLYLKEQPEDPERYLNEEMIAKQRYPSYWAFPEWKWMKEKHGFIEVHFDQGRTGHCKRKPTTLGTNIYDLRQLQELRGPGSSPEREAGELTMEQRIQMSRSWVRA
eukprot:s781_g18.t1